jgi:hypothetical protein
VIGSAVGVVDLHRPHPQPGGDHAGGVPGALGRPGDGGARALEGGGPVWRDGHQRVHGEGFVAGVEQRLQGRRA